MEPDLQHKFIFNDLGYTGYTGPPNQQPPANGGQYQYTSHNQQNATSQYQTATNQYENASSMHQRPDNYSQYSHYEEVGHQNQNVSPLHRNPGANGATCAAGAMALAKGLPSPSTHIQNSAVPKVPCY